MHLDRQVFEAETELWNNTFISGPSQACPSNRMLQVMGNAKIRCDHGTYMPPTPLTIPPADFVGCQFDCPAGTYGNEPYLTSASCTAACLPGHYCPSRTAEPAECPVGTYLVRSQASIPGIRDRPLHRTTPAG